MFKKFGSLTIGGTAIESCTSFRVRGANNLTPDDFNEAKGFNSCVTRGRRERVIEVEAKDVDTLTALAFCGAAVAVSCTITGECDDDGQTLTIAATTCRASDLKINKSETGVAKTASVTLTAYAAGVEPITFVEAVTP